MRRRKVLIIYTGGTFGMGQSGRRPLSVPKLSPASLRRRFVERVPELRELADCDVDIAMNRDSAHVGPEDWVGLARRLRERRTRYDGFVVLHGTDTLAYTASALSFLLPGFDRPLVLTGAQKPLSALRTDARRNLISAVEIAAQGRCAGVSVFFDDRLLLGTRVRKRSASEFAAFESPHFAPLAVVGTEIVYQPAPAPKDTKKNRARAPRLAARFGRNVALLHMTPGFPAEAIAHGLLPELEALVLVLFPSGTAPTNDDRLLRALDQAHEHGIPVVLVSEGDPANYGAGRPLLRPGCVWAGDLTPECAYVKTSLILGQPDGRARFAAWWARI